MRDHLRVLCLGLLLLASSRVFRSLAARWYPAEFGPGPDGDDHAERARKLRRKFWKYAAITVTTVALVLLFQAVRRGGLSLALADWVRIAAVTLALMAALGRGGWDIETWKGNTVIERIDRGMYVIGQLGAGALLVFALTGI